MLIARFMILGYLSLHTVTMAQASSLTIQVEKPAYTQVVERESGGIDLLVSIFDNDITDKVILIEDIGEVFRKRNGTPLQKTIQPSVTWPNNISILEGATPLTAAIAGGFFNMPSRPDRTGAITLVRGKESKAITTYEKGWFYHQAEWKDVNKDGYLDIITARSNFNPLRYVLGPALPKKHKVRGELIWLENPGNENFSSSASWKSRLIVDGPEVHFSATDLDGDGENEWLAAESFQQRLRIYLPSPSGYTPRTISKSLGTLFKAEAVDLNNDQQLDLLVTNHVNTRKAGVFAFEVPKDLASGPFKMHTLIQGIETRMTGRGQASPGEAIPVIPHKDHKGKPWVVVSGDGSSRVHLLKPVSEELDDWRYTETVLLSAPGSITGGMAITDLDGDGWQEVIIPLHSHNEIKIVSLR